MIHTLLILVLVLMGAGRAHAATLYADHTLSANCTSGNYNKSVRDCSGTDGNAYLTIAGAVAPLAAGDTLYIRGGTWNERINLQDTGKTGTSSAWITISGYPGETVILRYTDTGTYGAVKARGARGYFIFQDFEIDGVNMAHDSGWQIRDGNHHFILRRLKVYNQDHSGIYVDASDIILEENDIHDLRSDCAVGNRHHALYLHDGSNLVARRNKLWNTPGGGIQLYPGPWTNAKLQDNLIHHTNVCSTSNTGGIVVGSDNNGQTGSIIDAEVTGNIIAFTNRKTDGTGNGTAMGLRVYNNGSPHVVSGTKIHNNVIYKVYNYTVDPLVGTEYCMNIASGAVNTDVRNNYMSDCAGGAGTTLVYNNSGTSTTASHNSCTAAENCPATNKVSVAAPTDVFIDPANLDFRLKQGTNALRNAGTSVSTRPAPVGVPDIGVYEQGEIVSASIVGGYLELVTSVMTPGVIPTSAISGLTVACGGGSPCVGSPTVIPANIKAGSNNVIQVGLSGISTPGTGTVSMGATNATDSLKVGGPAGLAQGLNSVSALTITGNLANTSGAGAPGGQWSHFPLTEGSGTVANDSTGNGNHGTVSSGVTWVNDASGTGVTIPTDATYRHIASTYGSGVNPSTQDFSMCVYGRPSLTGNEQKVVFSAGSNGTNQRWYAGWDTVSGQIQWGIGVQSSGFTTGSEFVATETLTLVCMVNDSTADTATLWVNGVKGTVAGKSVKTLTSYSLVGNLRVGNDGTFTTNNGGFTVYEIWVWDSKASDADLIALYGVLSPGGTSAGLSQAQLRWEHVYTNSALSPVVVSPKGDGSVDAVANGGVAFAVQYNCSGGACAEIAPRLYYSTDGVNFDLPVPSSLGAAGVAAWGASDDSYFNDGAVTGCVDATGLTANAGVTNADAVAGQTFALANNHCRSDRYVVRFGNVPDTAFWFRIKTDAGQVLASYPQTIKVNVIPTRANLGMQ